MEDPVGASLHFIYRKRGHRETDEDAPLVAFFALPHIYNLEPSDLRPRSRRRSNDMSCGLRLSSPGHRVGYLEPAEGPPPGTAPETGGSDALTCFMEPQNIAVAGVGLIVLQDKDTA